MLPKESLKDLLSQGLSDRDKALICLAVSPVGPRQVSDIKALAYSGGWRSARKRTSLGFWAKQRDSLHEQAMVRELTASGIQYVATIAGPLVGAPVPTVASSLRVALTKISNADTKAFVEEAITCYEGRQLRAAVVLSWVGAVSVLPATPRQYAWPSYGVQQRRGGTLCSISQSIRCRQKS